MKRQFTSLILLCFAIAVPALASYDLKLRSGDSVRLLEDCPYGNQYFDLTENKCVNCTGSNEYFNSTTQACTHCEYTNMYFNLTNNNCTECLPNQRYNATSLACENCNANAYFNKTVDACKACPQANQFYNTTTWSCEACPQGNQYFDVNETNTCKECSFTQYFDNETNSCTNCSNGTQYYNATAGMCVSCPPHFAFNQSNTTNPCQECGMNQALDNTTGTCQDCAFNAYYNATVDACTNCSLNNSYFDSEARLCKKCNANQLLNLTEKACQNCSANAFFDEETLSCKTCSLANQYVNVSSDGTNASCVTCTGGNAFFNTTSNECQSCSNNQFFNLTSSQCEVCPLGFFNHTLGACQACPAGQHWNITINSCGTCETGRYYNATEDQCLACDAGCVACVNTSSTCSACTSSWYLQKDSHSCAQTCAASGGVKTFGNNATNMCVFNGSCPMQTYANDTTGFCETCNSSCAACFGPTSDQCTVCTDGYYLVGGTTSCLALGEYKKWTENGTWPTGEVPANGSDIVILQNMSVLLDSNVTVGTLIIDGRVKIDTTLPLVIEASRVFVRGGSLTAGGSNDHQNTDLIIKFIGNGTSTVSLNLSNETHNHVADLNHRNNVFINLGRVTLDSDYMNTTAWSRLSTPFKPGTTSITLNDAVQWNASHTGLSDSNNHNMIVVTSSSFDWQGTEEIEVEAINGQSITVKPNSTQYHHGGSSITHDDCTMPLSAEVGIRSHSIRILSTVPETPLIIVNTHQVLNLTNPVDNTTYTAEQFGNLTFVGVGFENLGDIEGRYGAINILGMNHAPANVEVPSTIIGCTIWNSSGHAVVFSESDRITFSRNFIYKAHNNAVRVFNGTHLKITDNLIANTQYGLHNNATHPTISFWVMAENSTKDVNISGNVVVGDQNVSYVVHSGDCDTTSQVFSDNLAHSGNIGWLAIQGNINCSAISKFSAYKMQEGVIAYLRSNRLHASHLILSDNINSLTLNLGTNRFMHRIDFTDSLLSGLGFENCADCYTSTQECSGVSGMRLSTITHEALRFPRTDGKPLYAATSAGDFNERVHIANVTFKNFFDSVQDVNGTQPAVTLGATCSNNRIFVANLYNFEMTAIHSLNNSTLQGVAFNSLYQSHTPYALSAGNFSDDSGAGMNYSALYNYMIVDNDGTFFKGFNSSYPNRTILPNNPTVINASACNFHASWNGYECESVYGLLTFSSHGHDRFVSKVTPIHINSTNDTAQRNVLTNGADYTTQNNSQRTPHWAAILHANMTHTVNYTNNTPSNVLYQLQGRHAEDWVILQIPLNNSWCMNITVGNHTVQPWLRRFNGTQRLWDFVTNHTENLTCGSYMVNSESKSLELFLNGSTRCAANVHFVTGAYLTTSIALDVFNFTTTVGPDGFKSILAQTLNISESRIIIYGFKNGSTIIDYIITANTSLPNTTAQVDELTNLTQALVNASNSGAFQVGGKPINYNQFMISATTDSGVVVINSTTTVPSNSSGGGGNNDPNGDSTWSRYGAVIVFSIFIGLIAIFAIIYFIFMKYRKVQPHDDKEEDREIQMREKNDSTLAMS